MSIQQLLLSLKGKDIVISSYGGKGFEINAEKPFCPVNCRIVDVASDYFSLNNGAIIPIRSVLFMNRPIGIGY